ncbi:MAG: MOSC domain-containing protein [Roseobacter sp.]
MESPLKALIAGYAQSGQVAWMGLRPARRADMREVSQVDVQPKGLVGDHGASDKRAVTLLQAEHLTPIGSYLGKEAVEPVQLRRNFVIRGMNLSALKGRQVQVGNAVLEITGICAPCSRMEETLGKGGYSAVRGHGGWCARVIVPGRVALGDLVAPVPKQTERDV